MSSRSKEIAARIRARIAEMGLSESSVAEGQGRHRSVLSTQLRRLDKGGHLRDDTLEKLERLLGRSVQWILTGREPEGFRLQDAPAWPTASAEAAERYCLTPEEIQLVGQMRSPNMPQRLDAAAVAALARTLNDMS